MSTGQGQASSSSDHGSEAYESSHSHVPEDWYETLRNDEDDDDDNDADYVEEDEFMDVESGDVELEFVLEAEVAHGGANPGDDGEGAAMDDAEHGGTGTNGPNFLTHRQLLALLRGHDLGQVIFDDNEFIGWSSRRRRNPADPNRFPKVPSDEGRKLMESGVFGAFDPREPDRKRLARRILDRELGLGDVAKRRTNKQLMAQDMIPITRPEMIIHYDDPVCCGQFSDDGNFFYAAVKDFKVRMYDTSRPYNWKHYKTVNYPFGQWTITDASVSPDNKWLAYTSLQSNVCLAPTDPNDTGDPYTLDLGDMGIQYNTYRGAFPIFSIRFSGDGRNLVAGTGTSSIVVYDIERRQTLHHVPGHQDDVNAVCFADKLSPHILYSGSDDCTLKVWDTRSLGDGREAGAFVGHIEGLTYIDSKGDGRYILSNGKDQSMKLWDLRMAMSTARFEELDPMRAIRGHNYEYRWEDYDNNQWFRHPNDNSLVTFRGHKVQRTLIRCHFSPPGSTNSRYVYSGSYDGHVYVWNLDATLAAKINVKAVTENVRLGASRPPRRRYRTLVRDVGWHPNAPLLVASAWNGPDLNAGTATLHSFNENEIDEAEPEMGISVNEKLIETRSSGCYLVQGKGGNGEWVGVGRS
ncbi:WD40-repeat-containing domain protein [Podospora aff. communis PSN243]|uniref:WD40-repeat-containing domain protein n=1 Tax=Podospora aff. communis PSN243 TaxID=3040156 RepID=A0AAV9GX20_9PEZI|nr:WD40-repeat-containing domain protein [Podospora aff. communis PSN243]